MIGVLIVLAWAFSLVGAYALGYSDGKLAEEEKHLFDRLDLVIKKLKRSRQ